MQWLPCRTTGWELLPTFVTCAGPFARTEGVDRVVLPFGVAQLSASLQLSRSRLQG